MRDMKYLWSTIRVNDLCCGIAVITVIIFGTSVGHLNKNLQIALRFSLKPRRETERFLALERRINRFVDEKGKRSQIASSETFFFVMKFYTQADPRFRFLVDILSS